MLAAILKTTGNRAILQKGTDAFQPKHSGPELRPCQAVAPYDDFIHKLCPARRPPHYLLQELTTHHAIEDHLHLYCILYAGTSPWRCSLVVSSGSRRRLASAFQLE